MERICKKDDIQLGEMKSFDVSGKTILVANVGGSFYAIDNVCSHRGCPLGEGHLEDNTVPCPCHGAQFDVRTGEVKAPPAPKPQKSFKVKVEGSDVLVEI